MKKLFVLLLLPILLLLSGCDNETYTLENESPTIKVEMMKTFGVASEDVKIKIIDIQSSYGIYYKESVNFYEVEIKNKKLLVSIDFDDKVKIEKELEEN